VTVRAALSGAADSLRKRGVETPETDAEFLLGHVLGLSRTGLVLEHRRELTSEERAAFDALLERRGRREPLAYVLGEWGFRRLTIRTDARALVPRPETEILVERCLALLAPIAEPRVLDLGTGSGAIALAIADEHPGAHIVAVDSSDQALALARENLHRAGLDGRVELVLADLGRPSADNVDLVVSNPPYVAPEEYESLPPEVKDWEPVEALVSEDATDRVAAAAWDALRPGGFLVLEAADDRAPEVSSRLVTHGFTKVRIGLDLTGRERVVEGLRT
jgi:release factor glutamine methyltransferase